MWNGPLPKKAADSIRASQIASAKCLDLIELFVAPSVETLVSAARLFHRQVTIGYIAGARASPKPQGYTPRFQIFDGAWDIQFQTGGWMQLRGTGKWVDRFKKRVLHLKLRTPL
jgi:hypothetical protein